MNDPGSPAAHAGQCERCAELKQMLAHALALSAVREEHRDAGWWDEHDELLRAAQEGKG